MKEAIDRKDVSNDKTDETNEEKKSRVLVDIEDLREVTGGLAYCDTIMCSY
jgi:hypothetical protein